MTFSILFGILFVIIGTFIACLPLLIYVAFFDKKNDGAGLGIVGYLIIKNLRRNK